MTTPNEDAPSPQSIELDVEVPGTPEEIWEAIATGPGITSWFLPAEVAEAEGGGVSFDMGSGMEESGVVTRWDPPHRFAYEEEWQTDESTPAGKLATEWIVEARSGGTCLVRLVCSGFGGGEDWERELENMREGWSAYLHNLRLYATRFRGEPCHWLMASGNAAGPKDRAWAALSDALDLPENPAAGERAATAGAGAPAMTGVVERTTDAENGRGLMLRIDEPAPGVALIYVYAYRGQTFTSVHLYLFGDEAQAVVAREGPAWEVWMQEHFPPAADARPEAGAASR
jgi:uncharacterized protein YndB with AHSA1/START domain